MIVNYIIDNGAFPLEKAHEDDAGYDIRTPSDFVIYGGGDHKAVYTGIHIAIPRGYFGLVTSKSGLWFKEGIQVYGGIIDAGYTGPISVGLVKISGHKYEFKRGDKIAQIIFLPFLYAPELVEVKKLDQTERGDNGFGSTGK